MKIVYTGLESSGKTLALASKARELAQRNRRWEKQYGFTRKIYSNLQFSKSFYNMYSSLIVYWKDLNEIINLTGCDILWDEISSDFSALKREPLPKQVNRWLRQGAKQGVHIYATAQEFHDIHLDFRRRVFTAYHLTKVIGSSRGGENRPPVDFIWGLCLMRELNIHPYNEINPSFMSAIPDFMWISESLCSIFDTRQLIEESGEPPLEHHVRKCPVCKYIKVTHR